MFQQFRRTIDEEVPDSLAHAAASGIDPRQRGATWTYLTTDEPFGSMTERAIRGLVRMFRPPKGPYRRTS
jgi:preprotein translocase subunit SecA